jgi:GntR family transcriptional regulator
MLEREKIIRSWHGKGYFVLTPEHERFTLIYDECVDQYESKIQNIQLVEPDEELLHALSLKPRQRAVSIMRRMSDKTHTMILDILYFPYSKGMPLVEAEIKYARLPDLVRSKTSVFSIHTRLEIGAEAVRGEIAKRLELAEGTCVLVTYRYLLNENEQVVAYGKRFLHPAYGRLSAVSGYWAREKAD